MGSVPRFTVGLGACALLFAAVAPADAQIVNREPRPAPMYGELPDPRGERRAGSGRKAVFGPADKTVPGAPAAPVGAPASNPPARPSDPEPSATAADAVSATPAPERAAAPASLPSGLSNDAPDTAPSIGVAGSGKSNRGGPSPAATPEPTTLLLMGAGLAGLYRLSRRT